MLVQLSPEQGNLCMVPPHWGFYRDKQLQPETFGMGHHHFERGRARARRLRPQRRPRPAADCIIGGRRGTGRYRRRSDGQAKRVQSVFRHRRGAGADVVSGGELKRALAAGIPPEKILFSGIGKTETELRAALDADLLCINIESEPELELLSRLAAETGRTARISVRVNPDVDSGTHAKISTGKSENKFGIPLARAREVYAHAAKLPGIEVTGTDVHIGSQITDLSRMEMAFRILSEFVQALRADGHTISHVDFGGGLGIPYYMDRAAPPAPDAYAEMVKRVTHNLGCTLMFEPGRMIVGNAGILVTRVIYVKHGEAKNFVIIDAAMNDLIRPTLYEAHHDILPVVQPAPGGGRLRGGRGPRAR